MMRTALVAFTLLGLLASSTAAQNPQRLSNMVFVNDTVTGAKNEAARGLRQEHFQVWEDNIEQKVEYFSAEDTPWTFGIVLAVSGLLPGRADQTSTSIRDAVVAFRQTGNPN